MGTEHLFFRSSSDYEKHKDSCSNTAKTKYFHGRPMRFPCLGLEDCVEDEGGNLHIYLTDFVYLSGDEGGRSVSWNLGELEGAH